MISIIKRVFKYKHTLIICALAFLGLILKTFTHEITSTTSYSLFKGGEEIIKGHYFNTEIFAYVTSASIFTYIAWRSLKLVNKKVVYGAICLALAQILVAFIIWQTGLIQLEHSEILSSGKNIFLDLFNMGEVINNTIIPLLAFSASYFIFSVFGAFLMGRGFEKTVDMKSDYFGTMLVTTAYLSFVNIWVSILFVIAWILFELKNLPTVKL